MLKRIGIVFLAGTILLVGFVVYILVKAAIVGPENYEFEVLAGDAIAAKYLAHGTETGAPPFNADFKKNDAREPAKR